MALGRSCQVAALCRQLLSSKNWQGPAGPSLCLPLRSGPEALRRPLGPGCRHHTSEVFTTGAVLWHPSPEGGCVPSRS